MDVIEWSEQYAVGDPVMDAQHQMFFHMVASAARAVGQEDPAAVHQRIAFLVDYAGEHFDTEEQLMLDAAYPELAAHRALHQRFREEVAQLRERLDREPLPAVAEAVLRFAHAFLVHHIMDADLRLARYLRGRASA